MRHISKQKDKIMKIKLFLVAEFDNSVKTLEEARIKLDAFRESVCPSMNYGITLIESITTPTLYVAWDSCGKEIPDTILCADHLAEGIDEINSDGSDENTSLVQSDFATYDGDDGCFICKCNRIAAKSTPKPRPRN
jgi:hypothetical protein